jgi:hypothetical protein
MVILKINEKPRTRRRKQALRVSVKFSISIAYTMIERNHLLKKEM